MRTPTERLAYLRQKRKAYVRAAAWLEQMEATVENDEAERNVMLDMATVVQQRVVDTDRAIERLQDIIARGGS